MARTKRTKAKAAKRPKRIGPYKTHFLLEWRLATPDPATGEMPITQGRAAELLGEIGVTCTYATVGRQENGVVPYSQEMVEGLAKLYGIDVATLLSRDPKQPDLSGQLMRVWAGIPVGDRPRAIQTLKFAFIDDGDGSPPPMRPARTGARA